MKTADMNTRIQIDRIYKWLHPWSYAVVLIFINNFPDEINSQLCIYAGSPTIYSWLDSKTDKSDKVKNGSQVRR